MKVWLSVNGLDFGSNAIIEGDKSEILSAVGNFLDESVTTIRIEKNPIHIENIVSGEKS